MTPVFSLSDGIVCYLGHPVAPIADYDKTPVVREDALHALRLDFSPGRFRRTAVNLVFHPLHGPAVTVATDGVWVILQDGERMHVVQRSNVVGPVTATPVGPDEWDWTRNVRKMMFGRRPVASPKDSRKVRRARLLDEI